MFKIKILKIKLCAITGLNLLSTIQSDGKKLSANSNLDLSLFYIFMRLKIDGMHIAIAGNIGAGKTTLTELLAKHYRWEPQCGARYASFARVVAVYRGGSE